MTQHMTKEQILLKAEEIAARENLKVEFLGDVHSVGVGGDDRTYTPVLVLVGPFPGWDILEEISTEITNTVHVNRVTYELVSKERK